MALTPTGNPVSPFVCKVVAALLAGIDERGVELD